METAVGYVRLSQEDQSIKDTSIDNQIFAIKQFCEKNNLKLLKIFNDGYVSSAKDEIESSRPEFKKMLELRTSKLYSVVIVKNETRLGRSVETLSRAIKMLSAHQIKVLTLDGTDLTKDKMITNIKGAIAESHLQDSVKAQKDMMVNKTEKGHIFGKPPFGYMVNHRLEGGKLIKEGWVAHPKNAPILQEIFERFANENLSFNDVGKMCNRGKVTAWKILRNKSYIGIFEYKEGFYVNGVLENEIAKSFNITNAPKLITPELFARVQKKLGTK